jgi:hypothetical protein
MAAWSLRRTACSPSLAAHFAWSLPDNEEVVVDKEAANCHLSSCERVPVSEAVG